MFKGLTPVNASSTYNFVIYKKNIVEKLIPLQNDNKSHKCSTENCLSELNIYRKMYLIIIFFVRLIQFISLNIIRYILFATVT